MLQLDFAYFNGGLLDGSVCVQPPVLRPPTWGKNIFSLLTSILEQMSSSYLNYK